MGNGALAIGPKLPRPSSTLPGCVKTRLGEGCAELFSQLPSSERSCQYNRLPHRRNRDGSSTRKLDIGVFTQPGPNSDISGGNRVKSESASHIAAMHVHGSLQARSLPEAVSFSGLWRTVLHARSAEGDMTSKPRGDSF